jgi:hypothetical protein
VLQVANNNEEKVGCVEEVLIWGMLQMGVIKKKPPERSCLFLWWTEENMKTQSVCINSTGLFHWNNI